MRASTRRAWGLCGAVLALLAVFLAYLQPEFLLTATTWLWNCF